MVGGNLVQSQEADSTVDDPQDRVNGANVALPGGSSSQVGPCRYGRRLDSGVAGRDETCGEIDGRTVR